MHWFNSVTSKIIYFFDAFILRWPCRIEFFINPHGEIMFLHYKLLRAQIDGRISKSVGKLESWKLAEISRDHHKCVGSVVLADWQLLSRWHHMQLRHVTQVDSRDGCSLAAVQYQRCRGHLNINMLRITSSAFNKHGSDSFVIHAMAWIHTSLNPEFVTAAMSCILMEF